MHTRRAFALVELLTVAVVVALISTAVIYSTDTVRARARDASRRGTVDAYSTAMEQWRATSTGKTYFVSYPGDTCTASSTANAANNPATTGYGYMTGVGTGCVGYAGGGAGRMSRRSMPANGAWAGYPGSRSIVDALRESGVLASIRQDPLDDGKSFNDSESRDFILTLCDSSGYAAANPEESSAYAIFTQLELPNTATGNGLSDASQTNRNCGGSLTAGGWSTVDTAPGQTVFTTASTYNYGKGSRRF